MFLFCFSEDQRNSILFIKTMYFIEIIINIYENYYLEYPNNLELFVTKIILFIVKSKELFPKQMQFQLNECVFIIERQKIYMKQINFQEQIPIFCFFHISIEQPHKSGSGSIYIQYF